MHLGDIEETLIARGFPRDCLMAKAPQMGVPE